MISKLAVLAAFQFVLYAAEGAAPDYSVESLHFDHVGGAMLFRLPAPIWNALSHFGFYKVVKRLRMDPVLVSVSLYRVTGIDWSSSRSFDDFVVYDYDISTVQGYPAKKNEPVKRQNFDEGPMVPVNSSAVDVN